MYPAFKNIHNQHKLFGKGRDRDEILERKLKERRNFFVIKETLIHNFKYEKN